jgi:hypothetical protein
MLHVAAVQLQICQVALKCQWLDAGDARHLGSCRMLQACSTELHTEAAALRRCAPARCPTAD